MNALPDVISDVEELEELLSRPSPSLVEYFRTLEGDIMVLGAGGKVGPTLTRMAKHAVDAAGASKRVIAVARTDLPQLASEGVEVITGDLLDTDFVNRLPRVKNVAYLVGRKFGSTGNEWLTWAINLLVPHHVAAAFHQSNIVMFSTGCVYPIVDVTTGGSVESDCPEPVGEYAMSCLGRERIFDYYAAEKGVKVIHIRLNYALEMRYGVLVDIATKVFNGEPVDVTTGHINGIWQGDCNSQVLQCFDRATSPSAVLNVTGPETLSVRELAQQFGKHFNKEPSFTGEENGRAYLNNASQAQSFFGNPSVPVERIVAWTARWVEAGGENIGKPTHFETQDGKY